MKKIALFLTLLLLASCGTTTLENPTNDNPNSQETGSTDSFTAYSGDLIVSGVGPDVSFESTIPNDTLALKFTNLELSYTDHLFISGSLLGENSSLNIDDITLPGNKVHFEGKVKGIDAGAGNHYYQVTEISKLEKTGSPTKEEVQSIIDSFGYCEVDTDCSSFYGECPLDCHQAVNTKYLDIAKKVMNTWADSQNPRCVYGCVEIKGVKCENYQCKAIPEVIQK